MPGRLWRLLAALLLLPLGSCVLTPGKFTAQMTINADRSFAFSYVGEVYAFDLSGLAKAKDAGSTPDDRDGKPALRKTAFAQGPDSGADQEATHRALALALAREPGFRRVDYLGKGRFQIDYAIRGRLDHAFLWPYNLDAEVVFPFVAVELRPDGAVRLKAPGFANESAGRNAVPGIDQMADSQANRLDGVFTLDTDAEIVSQNEESGVQNAAGRKRVVWRATPALRQAPTAVLRLAPLP